MKHRLKGFIVFIALMIPFSGCASYRAYYDIGLTEVERPAQAKARYGEQKITTTKEEGVEKYYFEDELLKILWLPSSLNISFALSNKTDHSIKIIWDEAAYVDSIGVSHRVMHSGVKYTDRNSPQPPTVVPRKGTINDLIFPSDYVDYVSGQYGGWREQPLFPSAMDQISNPNASEELLKAEAEKYLGKSVQVLLPLQIEDTINEYIFTFTVNGVKTETISPKPTKSPQSNP